MLERVVLKNEIVDANEAAAGAEALVQPGAPSREELTLLLDEADEAAILQADEGDQQPSLCGIRIIYIKLATYSFPAGAAFCEAAQTAIDLKGKWLAIIIPATICNFGAALSINTKYNHEGIEDAFTVIEQRKIPADWPELSKAKEITAAIASILMGGWAAFSDSVLAYYFVNELRADYAFINKNFSTPIWKGASGVTAAFVGLNIISGEGMATWKKAREVMAGVKPEYSNRVSRYLSPTLGYTIAVFGCFNDGVMTSIGLNEVFGFTTLTPRIATGVASISNMITDYCMNGAFVIECLDLFFGSFTPEEGENPAYKDPKIIAAFILSLAAGGLLAYTYHGITKEMMLELLETFGIDYAAVTDPIIETLACGGATSFFINSAGSVYPISKKLVEVTQKAATALGNKLNSIYNSVYSCCFGANVPEDFFDLSEEAQEFADDFEVVVDAVEDEFHVAESHTKQPAGRILRVVQEPEDDAETSHDDEPGDDAFFDASDSPYAEAYSYHSSEEERTARMLFNLFTPNKDPNKQQDADQQNSLRK